MNFGSIITAIGGAISSVFNYLTGRSAAKNAPDVKAGAIAASEQAQVDRSTKAVADGDVKEIERELAE